MADYNPPIENLPIFDPLLFRIGDEFITQNDADNRYLRYPNAQGTENLQTINVNGVATFNTIVKSKEQLQLLDTTPAGTTTECLVGANSTTNNRFALVLNPVSGAYGGLCLANDNLLVSGDSAGIGLNQPLTIETWSTVTNGVRISDSEVIIGCGGTAHYPTNSLVTTPSGTNLYGSTFVYNNILMNASLSTNRQISTGYLNLNPVTGSPGATGTQIYQSNTASYWDNNTNGGTITFATNTTGGVQVLPLNITSTFVETNLPFKINTLGNYLQFPDGTQQTTAYSATATGKTYSTEYTSSATIPLPANLIGISIRLVGKGGLAGTNNDAGGSLWNSGGSGGGASMCISQTILSITTGSLSLTINNSAGQSSFISYNGVELCRAYNGNNGGSASSGSAGLAGSAQISGSANTNAGTWLISTGSAGIAGSINLPFQDCSVVPQSAGKPNAIITTGTSNDAVRGCGQRYSAIGVNNQCQTPSPLPQGGSAIITYYLI